MKQFPAQFYDTVEESVFMMDIIFLIYLFLDIMLMTTKFLFESFTPFWIETSVWVCELSSSKYILESKL